MSPWQLPCDTVWTLLRATLLCSATQLVFRSLTQRVCHQNTDSLRTGEGLSNTAMPEKNQWLHTHAIAELAARPYLLGFAINLTPAGLFPVNTGPAKHCFQLAHATGEEAASMEKALGIRVVRHITKKPAGDAVDLEKHFRCCPHPCFYFPCCASELVCLLVLTCRQTCFIPFC